MEKTNILPITLAIPTMNRPQTLARTLSSYLAADCWPAQIIVVDQSQTVEMQQQNQRAIGRMPKNIQVNYMFQKNPSSTKARNNALGLVNQDIIVWSDDDVEVYKDTLKNLYDLFQNSSISMVAGLNDCARTTNSKVGYLLGTKSFFKRKIGHITASMLGRFPRIVREEIPTQWAMGFFFAVRTPLLKKWNIRWDENLTSYAYAEDLDFSYSYYKHATAEGLHCLMSDKVHVKHLASQEYRIPSKKATYMYVCNRYYLAHKHGTGLIGNMAMVWTNLWMLLFRIVKNENPRDIWNAIWFCVKNRRQIKKGKLEF